MRRQARTCISTKAADDSELGDLMDEELRADTIEARRSKRAGERPARRSGGSGASKLATSAPHPAAPAATSATKSALDPLPTGPRLPHRQLTLALRLAVTFGTAAAIDARLRPGSLTVIGEIEPDRLNDLCRVLSDALLPPEWASVRDFTHAGRHVNTALILAPLVGDGKVTPFAMLDMMRHIPEALEIAAPVFVLLPRDLDPAHEPGPELPEPVPLRPLSSEILIEHLRHSHSLADENDAAALRAALMTADTVILETAAPLTSGMSRLFARGFATLRSWMDNNEGSAWPFPAPKLAGMPLAGTVAALRRHIAKRIQMAEVM